jgi:hypothetical protein
VAAAANPVAGALGADREDLAELKNRVACRSPRNDFEDIQRRPAHHTAAGANCLTPAERLFAINSREGIPENLDGSRLNVLRACKCECAGEAARVADAQFRGLERYRRFRF